MPVSADAICQSGVSYPTAVEIARQMNAGVGNGDASKLVACGISPMRATELARQINAGTSSAHLLTASMWNPVLARTIKTQSGL